MQCLQRWKKVLKPGLVKGSWLPADDEALMRVLDGVDSSRIEWATVAQHFPMRSARDCRERWKYFLSPLVRSIILQQIFDHVVIRRTITWYQTASRRLTTELMAARRRSASCCLSSSSLSFMLLLISPRC
jgi:hypothetical protein